MFDCGALTTITPRRVAAATSTLSSPMPARPTTTRSAPASSTSAVTWVAERMMRPCAPATACRSSSADRPRRSSTSWPASRRWARPRGASCSVTRILAIGAMLAEIPGPAVDRSVAQQLADARDPFDQIVVGQGEGQPRVAGGAERLARHDRHPRLVEDDLGQLDGRRRTPPANLAIERAFERGERVEGALGLDARHAGNLVQQVVDLQPPTVEGGTHRGDRLEVARHRGEGGRLRHVGDV